jgi:hypothetical protein
MALSEICLALLLLSAAVIWLLCGPARKWAGPYNKTAIRPEPRLLPVPVTQPNRRPGDAASGRRPACPR